MGPSAIDYAIHCARKPALAAVTDLDRTASPALLRFSPPQEAVKSGVELICVNTSEYEDADACLMPLSDGKGYNDVLSIAC